MTAFGGYAWQVLLGCLVLFTILFIYIRFWGTYMGD